jgi:uncharacterized protein YbaP (TraB family)
MTQDRLTISFMRQSQIVIRLLVVSALILFFIPGPIDAASVWKVTGPNGGLLYLGGSIHALRSSDYPLPSAYNRVFDASSRLAFEVDEKALTQSSKGISKAGEFPHGDSLKKHVDPRTYDYLKRLFGLMGVSEDKFAKYRPWYLALMLESLAMQGRSDELGVEQFLARRARANSKPVTGLESAHEHMEVFSGLTDRQSEAYLLLEFIPSGQGSVNSSMSAWRRGDADSIARDFHAAYRDFPSLAVRLLDHRNHNWVPKIENYLRSGQTYFVVVGAAHLGGSEGLIALLRARGCKIEQL